MKVFVYGFWSGFLEKTDPVNIIFFLKLLSNVFDEECNLGSLDDSDILLESVFTSNTYLKYKKWKYTFCFSGESNQRIGFFCSNERLETFKLYNCLLSGEQNHKNVVNIPLFIPYIYCNHFINKLENPTTKFKVPEKDICIIVSNPEGKERNLFFDKLEENFKIDYAGNYKNNVPKIKYTYNTKEFQEFVSEYKFIISMDNSKDDTYITEKITHGLLAGNIPVYWGSDYINDYFNINRFINVENMNNDTIENAINKIKSLINNSDEYLKIVNKNIFPNENNKLTRTIKEITNDIKNLIFKKSFPLINDIYIISSPIFEPERIEFINNNFTKKLKLSNYNIKFHCPTYRNTITKEILKGKIEDDSIDSILKNKERLSEISLFINHISVLKDIQKNYKDGYFLICESDIFPSKNINIFNETLELLNKNKDKWDVINIGSTFEKHLYNDFCDEDFTNKNDKIQMILKRSTRCTDSFIWSYSGIIKYLNLINNDLNFDLPYDHYMNYIFKKNFNNFKCYWSIPSFFIQATYYNILKSTIR